ncbi:Cytochrome c oxidase assembly factor 5 [Melipona quadrifasciata]|uniref:Cytochrome c oxidase assembly factor 5 n=1 Tax=Melipona quadrifasciata TaxID=166423 RepID=A0A0N0U6T7_9HYME|nr:Cytochrome c oxidase assembly factor 5 [Melipona quadrifasciata]
MVEYEEEVRTLKDKTKCAHLRAKLKTCLLQTDCCKIERRIPKECLQIRHPSIPDECYLLRQSFFDCKHSIIDGRRRFRGPKGG